MADYWISQNRKFCEFCRCWITDNRPSVEFHEKGRRHQNNVQKKLRTITKHSNQTKRTDAQNDLAMQHMESAALKAYKKDMESGGDITGMMINQRLQQEQSESGTSTVRKLWKEVQNKGASYYVNIMTNERVEQPPKEGYLSIAEQKEQSLMETKKQLMAMDKQKRMEGLANLQETKAREEEERARLAREKLKERRVVEEEPQPVYAPLIEPGKTEPYGQWQTVKEKPEMNLQLPEQQDYFVPVVEYEPEPAPREFKEKIVQKLEDDGESSGVSFFKKRKIGTGVKRNVRQRLDDD